MPFGEYWLCPLFFKLTASSGMCLIAWSRSPIGLKPSHQRVLCVKLCVQSDWWQARALILTLSPWDRSLPPSFHQSSQSLILTSSHSRGLAQVFFVSPAVTVCTLSMMAWSPTRRSSILETHRWLHPATAAAVLYVTRPRIIFLITECPIYNCNIIDQN